MRSIFQSGNMIVVIIVYVVSGSFGFTHTGKQQPLP